MKLQIPNEKGIGTSGNQGEGYQTIRASGDLYENNN